MRRQIIEAGITGTGVVKGPFPKERMVSSDVSKILNLLPLITDDVTAQMLAKELETMLLYTPQIECIKVENCYPDNSCGTDIQNGKFFGRKFQKLLVANYETWRRTRIMMEPQLSWHWMRGRWMKYPRNKKTLKDHIRFGLEPG